MNLDELSAADAEGEGQQPRLPPPGSYNIDPPHAFVYFDARHNVVGLVRGRFDQTSGTLLVANSAAECTLDISIVAESLSTQNRYRDEDLRGPSFFDTAQYPAIRYQGRGLEAEGAYWNVKGSLQIREVTREVDLRFRFEGVAPAEKGKPARIAFHGLAAVKRADFGMTRDLLEEIGLHPSNRPDVVIEIDVEALATA